MTPVGRRIYPRTSNHASSKDQLAFFRWSLMALQDITPRNTLVAVHPSLPCPRLLLADFEFAQQIDDDGTCAVDLWWYKHRRDRPPEGMASVNGFHFDLYCLGFSFKWSITRVSLSYQGLYQVLTRLTERASH